MVSAAADKQPICPAAKHRPFRLVSAIVHCAFIYTSPGASSVSADDTAASHAAVFSGGGSGARGRLDRPASDRAGVRGPQRGCRVGDPGVGQSPALVGRHAAGAHPLIRICGQRERCDHVRRRSREVHPFPGVVPLQFPDAAGANDGVCSDGDRCRSFRARTRRRDPAPRCQRSDFRGQRPAG